MTPEEIHSRRVEAGMTTADLASALGCHSRTIERWEVGETFPSKAELIALDVLLSEEAGPKSSSGTRRKSSTR